MTEKRKRNKSKPLWLILVELVIAVAAVWFIYRRVFEKENIGDLFKEYLSILHSSSHLLLLSIIFFLMIVNWSLEAIKWKMMMSKLEELTFLHSLAAIFSGLTISFFTPNRIGEYAGRVFHLIKADRIKATLVTVIENFSQLLVTIVVGSIALIYYLYNYISMPEYIFIGLALLNLIFAVTLVALFLNVSILSAVINRVRWLHRFKKYLEVVGYYSPKEMLRILLLAFFRYMIFTFQFYLLLILFGVHLSYLQTMVMIAMIFYVMSVIPTIALTELGVRGAVATYFLVKLSPDTIAILNSTVSLWLINLVVPALIGTIFVFQFKFRKTSVQ